LAERALENPSDPFSRRDGWRSLLPGQRRFSLEYYGLPVTAWLTYGHAGQAHSLHIGAEATGTGSPLDFRLAPNGSIDLYYQDLHINFHLYHHGETIHIFSAQGAAHIQLCDPLAHAGEQETEGGGLAAPMPGKILSFAVQAGDSVTKGQILAIMEAMKMEHSLTAPHDGVVQELLYAIGDQVQEGAELLRLQVAVSI